MLMDIKCSEQGKFIALLAYLEAMGNIGHCTDIHIRFDGDGCSRLKVEFPDNDEMNEKYRDLREESVELCEKFINEPRECPPRVECSFIFD